MMALGLPFYFKVMRLFLGGHVVPSAEIRDDYDRLSPMYDDHFSQFVAPHSLELVRRLDVRKGACALDLACGTGTVLLALAEAVGDHGAVVGVDRSRGMMNVADAKRKVRDLKRPQFVQADMTEALDGFAPRTFDAATCAWAIGYGRPGRTLALMADKLKPGGKVGLIENARDTLAPVRSSCMKVAAENASQIKQVMDLHRRLPRHTEDLGRWFRRADLTPLETWQGQVKFRFESGADVLDWVLHTGASAGFHRMMASDIREKCDARFIEIIEQDYLKAGVIEVAHKFVAGIAQRSV